MYAPNGYKRRRLLAAAGSRLAIRGAQAVGQGLYQGIRKRVSNYVSGKRYIQPADVTNQFDSRTRYRRKSMPRFKRRRWRKFSGKVKHVMLQLQPLRAYTYDVCGQLTAGVNVQNYAGYMCGANSLTANDEIFQCFKQEFAGATTVANAAAYKLFVKSVALDLQFRNSGSSSMVIDLYTVQLRKEWATTDSLQTLYGNTFNEMGTLTTRSSTAPATTPWQNSNFCSYFKILSKKEIILGVGNVSTHQLRNPQNRNVDGKELSSSPAGCPGKTVGFFWMIRGVPETVAGPVNQLSAVQLEFGLQWTVTYGVPPSSNTTEAIQTR